MLYKLRFPFLVSGRSFASTTTSHFFSVFVSASMSPSISFQFERSSLCCTGFCIYNHQSSMFTSADFLNSNRNGSVAFLMYQAALFSSALTQLSQAICPLLPFSLIPTIYQCHSWDEKPHTSLITSLFSKFIHCPNDHSSTLS